MTSRLRAVPALACLTVLLAGCSGSTVQAPASPSGSPSPAPSEVAGPAGPASDTSDAPKALADRLLQTGDFIAKGLADGSLGQNEARTALTSSQGEFNTGNVVYYVNPSAGAYCVEETADEVTWRFTYQSAGVERASCADPETGSAGTASGADVALLSTIVEQLLQDDQLNDNADTRGGTITHANGTLTIKAAGKTLTAQNVLLSDGSELRPSYLGARGAYCIHVRNLDNDAVVTQNGVIPTATSCNRDGTVN